MDAKEKARAEEGGSVEALEAVVACHRQGGRLRFATVVPETVRSQVCEVFEEFCGKAYEALGVPAFSVEGDGYRFTGR
jgi:hypothetical protein